MDNGDVVSWSQSPEFDDLFVQNNHFEKLVGSSFIPSAVPTTVPRADEESNVVRICKSSSDEEIEIDVTDENMVSNVDDSICQHNLHSQESNEVFDVHDSSSDIDVQSTGDLSCDNEFRVHDDVNVMREVSDCVEKLVSDVVEICDFDESSVARLSPPDQEVTLAKDEITESEKAFHREFFEGRLHKTPDRYLKIRNYILDSWDKCRPRYLNKTSLRPGLKNCGDVNCIGRIHMYLEWIGAINFGCEQASYKRENNPPKPTSGKAREGPSLSKIRMPSERLKTQKTSRGTVSLIAELENGGYTIKHSESGDTIIPGASQKVASKPRTNPFKLIACSPFTPEVKEPFVVSFGVEAAIIMDIHSHMSSAEVIGLLGGYYDGISCQLHVSAAEPCISLSTGRRECEIDPVSQMEASDSLEQHGLSVVGWYHSHPTFPPNPSVRDIETQAQYQEWFGKQIPFIGAIITPYGGSVNSKLNFLVVGDSATVKGSQRQPYQLTVVCESGTFTFQRCLEIVNKHWDRFSQNSNSIILNSVFEPNPRYTYMEKLLVSIRRHLENSGIELYEEFVNDLQQLLTEKAFSTTVQHV